MRRIEVVEKTYDSFLFSIDKYAFKYTQCKLSNNLQ